MFTRPTKPKDVPSLNLNFLGKDVDVVDIGPEITPYNSARSMSTVSWGTSPSGNLPSQPSVRTSKCVKSNKQCDKPVNHSTHILSKNVEGTISDNLAPPSSHYLALYKQYAEEMKESYQEHAAKLQASKKTLPTSSPIINATVSSSKLVNPTENVSSLSNSVSESRVDTPEYAISVVHHSQKKRDAEAMLEFKKKEKIVETVMIDQLSRAVISEPHHEVDILPANKRHPLHNTTRSTMSYTERLLSDRISFGVRILSRHDSDKVRQVIGFFFNVDQTLTIYEYRKFGKSAKVLPFIKRGHYRCIRSNTSCDPYRLVDIYAGANLEFDTSLQDCLPEAVRRDKLIRFRVTDVDEEAKRKILLKDIHPLKKQEEYINLHIPSQRDEIERRLNRLKIQKYTRSLLESRGIKTVLGLWHTCLLADVQDTGQLSRYDLEKLILKYHIDPPTELMESLFDDLDNEGSGYVDYGEFLRGFLGEMNEHRKSFVRRAFQKLDHKHCGVVSFSEVRKFYSAYKNPSVVSGEVIQSLSLDEFLGAFLVNSKKEEISATMFEAFYEGVSISVGSCDLFIDILRNTWRI